MRKTKKSMKNNFFGKKGITSVFAVIALVFGFWFLDSDFTGNTIVNKPIPINLLSLIGLLLIACSVILISYPLKKK